MLQIHRVYYFLHEMYTMITFADNEAYHSPKKLKTLLEPIKSDLATQYNRGH